MKKKVANLSNVLDLQSRPLENLRVGAREQHLRNFLEIGNGREAYEEKEKEEGDDGS